MRQLHLAFIGAGNMANSLIGGLLAANYAAEKIIASDPNPHIDLQQCPINLYNDNLQAAEFAEVVVLSVKPQILKKIILEIKPSLIKRKPLIISIAAGIRAADISAWLNDEVPVIRSMPNTPALIKCGATALFANKKVSVEQKLLAEAIMQSVGITVWVDNEDQIDVVTALSGSGPAYFFHIMECLQQAAVSLGLPDETARLLTLQTALGSARMALESGTDVTSLRKQVTSPGGTTESALTVLQNENLQELLTKAIRAATQRSKELSTLFGE